MITTFKITDQKAIKRAECVCVPRIMIIKGQNGAGKSTLLYALNQKILGNGVTKEDVIFISPSGESQHNEHTGADAHRNESSCKITSILSRLEVARRNIIASSEAAADEYTSVSYIYEPLNKLLNTLLPHLKFERVDISDTDSSKCIFSKDTLSGQPPNQIELGKLSRAEIGVISQFLPLVEHQILRKLVRRSDASSYSDIVVLMDMPGLYLQPQIQSRLLEYVRSVVKENENIQFIIATNSSALIDKATTEELFMLMPSQQLPEGSNQLVKVSDATMCKVRI
jgi:predicted ATP-binding protein involved in virulence